MGLRQVFSFLSLLAILAVIIYFESMYLPFTTECYYVRGAVIYDTPCLALSTVLESLGLVALSLLFSNRRAFLVTSVAYFGFPLLMGATNFERALAGIALVLSVLFALLGSTKMDFKVAFTWVLGAHVYSIAIFFLLWIPFMLLFDRYLHPRELLEGSIILLFFFSPLLWRYRGCWAFFAFSALAYVVLYFLIPGFYLLAYEAFLSLVGLLICLKGGAVNEARTEGKS